MKYLIQCTEIPINILIMPKKLLKYKMCAARSCCPQIEQVEDDKFIITDDYNGKVQLSKDELVLLQKYLTENLE